MALRLHRRATPNQLTLNGAESSVSAFDWEEVGRELLLPLSPPKILPGSLPVLTVLGTYSHVSVPGAQTRSSPPAWQTGGNITMIEITSKKKAVFFEANKDVSPMFFLREFVEDILTKRHLTLAMRGKQERGKISFFTYYLRKFPLQKNLAFVIFSRLYKFS